MIDYFIGTMGFSYRDRAGPFYPQGLPARDYLSYYGRIFNAVEIDSTFYGIPRRGTVIRWRETTPQEFKICVKVPRSITHEAGLVDSLTEMNMFIESIRALEDKLGVILFQFPPSFDIHHYEKVDDYMRGLPENFRFAVEFRHPSWYSEYTADMLKRHNICWVATEFANVPKEVYLTTNMIFIRFIGKHGQFKRHDRERIDVSPQLEWWWQWIMSKADQVSEIYGFFNDDFSGHAPAAANKLKQIIGLPVVKNNIPEQMRLL
jgi:uncharacterized protein YecE (DUF72 family)